jgi:hypothetical protein
MMRAVVVGAPGPAEWLVIAEVPDPRPGPGELSIDVEFAGVGFVDTLFRSGAFTLLPVPFIPGIEVTGWVRAAGPGVTGFVPGQRVGPRKLVHGHTLLTEVFTVDVVPGLLAALTELREHSLAGIGRGLTLTALLKANVLPDVLREHSAAAGPYLAIRDHFVQRLYHQHSGYWQPDGQGLEPVDPADRAAALDLLADGRPEQVASAARTLLAQRDPALALEIISAGLASHPDNHELAQLRQQALYRLMERHRLQDPFRFLIYAEMADAEIGPTA